MTDPTANPPRCPTCGNEGPVHGKAFCEVCGEFVDWGELAAASRAEPATSAASAPTGTERTSDPPAGLPGTGRSASAAHRGDETQKRARELLVPLADAPQPVLPDRPEAPRPDVAPVMATEEHGIVCWNCGVENNTDRRFCRNCGVELGKAPTTPSAGRPGPWQRLLSWFRRHRRGVLIGLAASGVLAGLAALAIFVLLPLVSGGTTVAPAAASATVSDPAHPPTSAFDGSSTSWWGTGTANGGTSNSGDSSGDALTATFKQPVDIRSTRIVPGTSDNAQDRNKENRPQRVDLTFTDDQGHDTTFSVVLKDDGPQEADTHADHVVKATVTVRSAYNSGAGKEVAIAEVQFRS